MKTNQAHHENKFGFHTSRNREGGVTLRLLMARDEQRLLEMGARIKELRLAHGYKQQTIADHVGVELRTYQNWQAGKVAPQQDSLQRLADMFEVEPRYIMRGDTPDLFGTINGESDALARLERIETAINQLRDDHALILKCVDQLQAVIEQLGAAGVLQAVATASEAIVDNGSEAPTTTPTPAPGRDKRRLPAA